MTRSKTGQAIQLLVLLLTLALAAQAQASFGFWLARPNGRNNPHDPAGASNKNLGSAAAMPSPTATAMPCRAQPLSPQVVLSNNAFALNLFASLLQSNGPDNNLTYSPFSVSTALAMTWAGTQGQTASQMADVLQYQDDPTVIGTEYQQLQAGLSQTAAAGGLTLTVANSLWLNNLVTFSPSYLSFVQQDFLASVTNMSFADPMAAANQINAWVNQETNQMIPSILAPTDINPGTSIAYLLNAIYLKAPWTSPFAVGSTQPKNFYGLNGNVTTTAMMNQTSNFFYLSEQDAQVVELPYGGDMLSMLVVLPSQGTSLASLEARLTTAKLNEWVQGLCGAYVDVSLPKLNLSFGTVDLKPNLQAMGMTDAFVPEPGDFSPMVPDPNKKMYIAFVKHKAVVDVDESGTLAAAVTAVGVFTNVGFVTMKPQPVVFDANRPFLFLIRDRATGTLLFMGSVTNPTLN